MSNLRKLVATTKYPRPEEVRESREEWRSLTDRDIGVKTDGLGTDYCKSVRKESGCPLDYSECIQPVGVTGHYIGRCYCYLCKCGKHRCPADLRKSATLRSCEMWRSSYKQEYTKKNYTLPKAAIFRSETALPVPRKMDLVTTQKHDFPPPPFSPYHKRIPAEPKPTVKLVSRTSYKRDFPDWKAPQVLSCRGEEVPHRSVAFRGNSMYKETFAKGDKGLQFEAKKETQWSSPIAPLRDFYGETSHKTEYKQYENQRFPVPKLGLPPPSCPQVATLSAPTSTTYRSSYPLSALPTFIPFKPAQ